MNIDGVQDIHVFMPEDAEEALRIATREVRKVHDGKLSSVQIDRDDTGWIFVRTYTNPEPVQLALPL